MDYRRVSFGCFVAFVVLLSACGPSTKLSGWDTSRAGTPVVHYPGDGGVIIISEAGQGSGRFTCVAPPAQAALGFSTKSSTEGAVEAEAVKVSLSGSHESVETIVKLAEMNERSLFLQYALYRLCEAAVK